MYIYIYSFSSLLLTCNSTVLEGRKQGKKERKKKTPELLVMCE